MRFLRRAKEPPVETNEEPPAFLQAAEVLPPAADSVPRSSFMEDLRDLSSFDIRTKPSYSDCWLLGSPRSLDIIEEYDTPSGHVVVGTAPDGETEYNLTPSEYAGGDSVNTIIEELISRVRQEYRRGGGRTDRLYIDSLTSDLLAGYADRISVMCGGSPQAAADTDRRICDIVYRYTVGLGVFDILLSDPRLEDIYIDAPCDRNRIHVTLSNIGGTNGHGRCRTNLVVDRREVMNLVCHLKKVSGLPFSQSNPVLETDMGSADARATVVGYPLSPGGDAVAIRKHSAEPWTLTRLIANGTLDARTAGLLSFLVQNRAAFLVCGARGAGKSSLLSAMMFEFPKSQRILTVEDTMELPAQQMRRMGYKVQSMLVDERIEGSSLSRANEALRVSLRMGESAIVLGEVRGEEARTLYESMRTGRAGSSIMGTIHGDSAKSVYDRVVHDLGIPPEAFMATDVLVTMGTFRDPKTGIQTRRVSELVSTTNRKGVFCDLSDPGRTFSPPVMRRILSSCSLTEGEAERMVETAGLLRGCLAEAGRADRRYLGPEWICRANAYQSRCAGKEPAAVVMGFREKYGIPTGRENAPRSLPQPRFSGDFL